MMNFTVRSLAFRAMAVAVTVAFAFGMSQRYDNWFILGIGAPLAISVAVLVEVWSDHEAKSVRKGGARDG